MSHRKLVEQVVSGKSAQHIIDALVEELPPLPMLYQIVRKEMPRGTGVRIEENVVFVKPQSKVLKSKVSERSDYLQLMFPELEFVVEQSLTEGPYVLAKGKLSQLPQWLARDFGGASPSTPVELQVNREIINQPGSKPDGTLVAMTHPSKQVNIPKLHMHDVIVALGGKDLTYKV